jgi:uncharacterized membrane protein
MKRKLLFWILALSLIALIASVLIQIENITQSQTLNNVCTATGSSCNSVQNTEYGKILGVKIADIGLFAFMLFTLLVLHQITRPKFKHKKCFDNLMTAGAIIAGLFGIYLISLQVFVINQYCTYCLIIDFSSIILMLLVIIYRFRK